MPKIHDVEDGSVCPASPELLVIAKLMAWSRSKILGYSDLAGHPDELWGHLSDASRKNWLERAAKGRALLEGKKVPT